MEQGASDNYIVMMIRFFHTHFICTLRDSVAVAYIALELVNARVYITVKLIV